MTGDKTKKSKTIMIILISLLGIVFFAGLSMFFSQPIKDFNCTFAEQVKLANEKTDINSCLITLSSDTLTYNGSELKKSVTITFDGQNLIENTDYTLSYSNNILAGDNAKVTITGMGNYKGSKELFYTIEKAEKPSFAEGAISVPKTVKKLSDITLPENWEWVYPNTGVGYGTSKADVRYVGTDKDNYVKTILTVTLEIHSQVNKSENPWKTVIYIMIPINVVFSVVYFIYMRKRRFSKKYIEQ